jgi:hypothetical protein
VEFTLQFDGARIKDLAGRYAYPKDEGPCRRAGSHARKHRQYSPDGLRTVCEWKSPRARRWLASNLPSTIRAVTEQALDSQANEQERLEALIGLRGVGVPTASALLHFAFPTCYPIIDFRALESLGITRSRKLLDRTLAGLRGSLQEDRSGAGREQP